PRGPSPHSSRAAAAKRLHVQSGSAREPTVAKAVDPEGKQRPCDLSDSTVPGGRELDLPDGTAPDSQQLLQSFENGFNGIQHQVGIVEQIPLASRETLIYRWCRRCWSLSYELRDETTDVHRI